MELVGNMATNLQTLNSLLKNPEFKLPAFRTEVNHGLGNLKWLRSKLPQHPACCEKLRALLHMDAKTLLAEEEK